MESSICRSTVPLLACWPRKSVQSGGSADSLIGFRRILSDDIGRLSLRHGRIRQHICRIERVKATGKSSAGGDAGNGEDEEEEEEEEDALQATIKKSQKVLAMQKDLLRQIAERKELVSKIRSGILDSEKSDEDGNGSFPNVDLAPTSDDANEDSNGVLSTMSVQSTADKKDFVGSAQVGIKDLPLREGSLDVDSDKKVKNGTVNTVLPNEKPTVLSRSSVVPTQQSSLAQKSYKPENTTSEVAKSARVEPLSMHSKKDLKDSYTGKSLSNVPSFLSKSSASSTPVEEKHEDLRESSAKEIHNGTEDSVNEDLKPPPLAGTNVMNIVLVAAECAPWCKTGGLGDVAGALPKALARRGHRVMVVVPRYGNYAEPQDTGVRKKYAVDGWDVEVGYFQAYIDGVDFVFIDSPMFHHIENNIYGGNRVDILKRMVLFCKAAVEAPWHVPCGGVCYGDGNLAFIANDWHTALLPVYLKAYYRDRGLMEYARSVLVVHNIAHQGRGPMDDFSYVDLPPEYADLFRLYDPVGGDHFNIFAAGLKMADRVLTVSHGYSCELKTSEGGWGLHGIINENEWKLRGIVNGIDTEEWNPLLDVHLKSDGYVNYSLETLQTGKPKCKAALQKELGLPVRPDVPLIGFIGRLDHQKGVDLIAEAIPWMIGEDVQLVMLGTGRPDLEQMLRQFECQHNDKVRGWVGFSVATAHRITAGADILLMPSRFEPCGLNQLYAMSYGTIPVVHAVGGLRDTVEPFDPFNETGLGWTFNRAEAGQLIHALGNCLLTYRQYKTSWEGLQKRGMMQDLSWDHAAQNYEEVLVAAKYQW